MPHRIPSCPTQIRQTCLPSRRALWVLRVLVRGGLGERILRTERTLDSDVLRVIGMPELAADKRRERIPVLLAQRLTEVEEGGVAPDEILEQNVVRLARLFELSAAERHVLALAATVNMDAGVRECFERKYCPTLHDLKRLVQTALCLPMAEVVRALDGGGALRKTRLVQIALGERYGPTLGLSDELSAILAQEHGRADALVAHFARRSPRPTVSLADFAHMAEEVDLIVRVTRGAMGRRSKGVNILFHGPPGTGKTELVKAVARQLKATLYQVIDEDADGDGLAPVRRLDWCALAQRMLARSRHALLLFDEVEDVFPHPGVVFSAAAGESVNGKSWTHRLLEENRIPTFWVTNDAESMDPATLRRFDVSIRFQTPPLAVRRGMTERRLAGSGVSEAFLTATAQDQRLTPAHLEKAAKVARLLGRKKPGETERALRRVLDENLSFSGPKRSVANPGASIPYDLKNVNANLDLDALAASLANASRASICLFGPPGSGKTAYVRHLADRLGKSLRVVRASDIFDKYVGETEKNLARVFRAAAGAGEMLFLDEADSFLQDRAGAFRSWEITQVNELLVQMDEFPGVFVCATNLIDTLDAASLRRFSLKIRFDPLREEQRWALVISLSGGPEKDGARLRAELDRLGDLTPGDFDTVVRRLRLVGTPLTAENLVRGLAEESAMKRGTRSALIGFRVGA